MCHLCQTEAMLVLLISQLVFREQVTYTQRTGYVTARLQELWAEYGAGMRLGSSLPSAGSHLICSPIEQ